MRRAFVLLPSKVRPSTLLRRSSMLTFPLIPIRNIYVRPKSKPPVLHVQRAKDSQSKEKESPYDSTYKSLITRVLETGGNLRLFEFLVLDKKHRDSGRKLGLGTDYKEYQIQGSAGKSVFAEIVNVDESIFRNILNRVIKEIFKHKLLQKFIILELIRLKNEEKSDLIERIWSILRTKLLENENQQETENNTTILQLDTSSNKQFIASLINLSLYFNNIGLLTQLALNNKVKKPLMDTIIYSLALIHPRNEEYTINTLLKIITQKNHKLTKNHNSLITSNKINNLNLFLQKKVTEILIENTQYEHDPLRGKFDRLKLQNYYKLIDINFELKNIAGCYITWCKIQIDFPKMKIKDHDVKILSKLLKVFNRSKIYIVNSTEIINSFKPFDQFNKNGNNEILLHNIISYYSKSSDFQSINQLIKTINPPFQRRTLDELLRVNLIMNDSDNNVEEILKEILKVYGSFTPLENSIVVKALLKKSKFKEALAYTDSLKTKAAKSSYLTFVDRLITLSNGTLDDARLLIINNFLSKVLSLKHDENYDYFKDPFWSMVSSMYFKYSAMKKENLETLRNIYEVSVNDIKTKAYYLNEIEKDKGELSIIQHELHKLDDWKLNPFQDPNSKLNFLLINDESKVMILKTIYDSAAKFGDTKTRRWCLAKFAELGLTRLEIMITLNKFKYPTVGFDNVRSSSFEKYTAFWEDKFPSYLKGDKILKDLP